MFKRLPEELTLNYVFKDGPEARIVGGVGHQVISLSLIYSFHLPLRFAFRQCTFPFIFFARGDSYGVERCFMDGYDLFVVDIYSRDRP